MTFYAQALLTPRQAEDLSPVPPELHEFARIENLIGEEMRLLEEPLERRNREHHEQLRAIGAELDHIWEALRERAEHRGRENGSVKAS